MLSSKIHRTLTAICAMCCAASAVAGDLNPPPGPIQSTNRHIINQQTTPPPYTITEPGSYVLTSNLTGVAGEHGIIVAASDVAIDLNGFTVRGVEGSRNGITSPDADDTSSFFRNLTVRNGAVVGWDGDGVTNRNLNLSTFASTVIRGARYENLDVRDCGADGITIVGTGPIGQNSATVIDCNANNNDGYGYIVAVPGVISNCIASGNGVSGYIIGVRTLISESAAIRNSNVGIEAADNCTIINCNVVGNNGGGIFTDQNTLVSDCNVAENQIYGVQLSFNSTIRDCNVIDNSGDGITCLNLGGPSGVAIMNNNSSGNTGWGVSAPGAPNIRAYNNTLLNNGAGAVQVPASGDAPISATAAGAGPHDNIGP